MANVNLNQAPVAREAYWNKYDKFDANVGVTEAEAIVIDANTRVVVSQRKDKTTGQTLFQEREQLELVLLLDNGKTEPTKFIRYKTKSNVKGQDGTFNASNAQWPVYYLLNKQGKDAQTVTSTYLDNNSGDEVNVLGNVLGAKFHIVFAQTNEFNGYPMYTIYTLESGTRLSARECLGGVATPVEIEDIKAKLQESRQKFVDDFNNVPQPAIAKTQPYGGAKQAKAQPSAVAKAQPTKEARESMAKLAAMQGAQEPQGTAEQFDDEIPF